MKSGHNVRQYLSYLKSPLLYPQWVPSLWKVSPYVRTDWLVFGEASTVFSVCFVQRSKLKQCYCSMWISMTVCPEQTVSSTRAHFRNAFLSSSLFNRTKCSITCFKCCNLSNTNTDSHLHSGILRMKLCVQWYRALSIECYIYTPQHRVSASWQVIFLF